MKVLDIIALREDLDIVPSTTVDANGRPAGFNVVDTDTGRTLRTFNDAGDAEEFRDAERARLRGAGNAPADSGDTDRASSNRRSMSRRFMARFRQAASVSAAFRRGWMYSLAGAIGLTLEHETRYEEQLQTYWNAAKAGELVAFPAGKTLDNMTDEEAREHIDRNIDRYDQIIARAYGLVAAAYYTSIMVALIGPAWRGGRATVGIIRGGRYLRRFIQWAKGIRASATAIAAGAGAAAGMGVGGIVTGLISFLLGSAAIWAVEYVLTRTEAGGTVISMIVNWTLKRDIDGAIEFYGMNANNMAGQFLEVVADRADVDLTGASNLLADVSSTELQRSLQDARRELLANPRASETDRRAADVLAPAAASEPAAGSGSNPPATPATSSPAQSRPAVNPNLFPELN